MIKAHNAQESSYKLGENQFMDLTTEESKNIYLGLLPNMELNYDAEEIVGASVTSIDWTAKGDVSAIKDQGQCGSCWAFSTTGSLESASAVQKGKLLDLSEQQLVDCSTSYGNQGCNGGLMDNAFKYIKAKGIEAESSYPYTATDGTCKYSAAKVVTKLTKFTDVPAGNCGSLQTAGSSQPVSIAVDAEQWQFYSSGIFNNCGTSLDHGVLLAGFNLSGAKNTQYWKVKNSWGSSWGEKGYIRLASGNTCGLCNAASFPTV